MEKEKKIKFNLSDDNYSGLIDAWYDWQNNPINNDIPAEIPDDILFHLLKIHPAYLQAPFTLIKVKKWQKDLTSNDSSKAFKAQYNLKKIGTSLALKSKSPRWPNVSVEKAYIYRQLKTAKILKYRSVAERRIRLKKLFGKQLIDNMIDTPHTYDQLANAVTAKQLGLTPQTVEKYCKNSKGYCAFMKKVIAD